MKSFTRTGTSRIVLAGVVVILLLVVGAGAFYAGMSQTVSPPTTSESQPSTITSIVTTTITTTTTVVGSSSLASSSSSTTSSTTSTSSSSQIAVPDNQSLIQKADQEGSLTWITTTDAADANTIAKAFESDFPGVTVNVIAVAGPSNIYTEVAGEFAGNKHTIDLASGSLPGILSLNTSGYVADYVNPVAVANYPQSAYDPDGLWTALYGSYYGVAYNTQELSGAAIPTTWSDLTSSSFNNQIAMDDPATLSASGSTFAGLYLAMSNSTWTQLMYGIKANNPVYLASSSAAIQEVDEGIKSVAVGVAYTDVQQAIQSGAPVAWEWMNPTPSTYSVVSLLNDAPHPYAAELFIQWMSSLHGQSTWQGTGRSTIIMQGGSSIAPTDISYVTISNISGTQNSTFWESVFTKIFHS